MVLVVLCCARCTLVEKSRPGEQLTEARRSVEEGVKLKAAGRYPEAALLIERALPIQEAALGPRHPDVASSLAQLGDLYVYQGFYSEAAPLFERALSIQEEALGSHHLEVAASLNLLGDLHGKLGRYSEAESLISRALAIREAALGPHHSVVAASLLHLASIYAEKGLYSKAESLYERALAIQEASLGPRHRRVAPPLTNLAVLYWRQGFYSKAEPLFVRALSILEETVGPHHPNSAMLLDDLAMLYLDQGLHAKAEPLLKRALAIRETALGPHHPYFADSLDNLARLYRAQRLYSKAESIYERVLSIQEAAVGPHHPRVADTLNRLALLYREQGVDAKAEPLFERALAIRKSVLGLHHPAVAASLNNLATLRLAQHHLSQALPLLAQSLAASEAHLRQEILGFSEARLASTLLRFRKDEERLYALVRVHPDDERVRRLALSAALLRKGRSLEEMADTSRIIFRDLNPEDRKTLERLRALRTERSVLALAGAGKLSPSQHQRHLQKLADQCDALERELARRSGPLRALRSQPAPDKLADSVASKIPKDGALIEFVAYSEGPLVPSMGVPQSESSKGLRYLALVLFADGRSHALDLGPAETIDQAASRLHQALAGHSSEHESAAQELYTLTLHRLIPLLGKTRRLFVSPDGQLTLVPFTALHDGRRFLVDAFEFTYLTSGKDLLPHPEDIPSSRSVVVLADPDFSTTSATGSVETESSSVERLASLQRFFSMRSAELVERPWLPLPGTRQEAEAIQRLFPRASLLLGRAASKDALLKLDRPGLLHIATHGFFLGDAATPPATRAVQQCCALADPGLREHPEDPLLRSGLVLAGANSTQESSGPAPLASSLVTALELGGMDLWGTQLVVLSACDTGRGDVKLGQGIYGLRRALVVAGAETVVSSLWKINDGKTSEFMEAFYRHLLAGEGRVAALHSAMREMRRKHPHPYYWAPFIATGKGAPLEL
ncbi:tetratricopeptide repeat protein [Archangium minus]|uniref:Tetratricopeptide repeat protein n=1 Tax=Archangium minus TaxID=83450 RepID=A0ABY9WL13_9BACT|nr:tetratricopeptide repeat protein [Archangium minus]